MPGKRRKKTSTRKPLISIVLLLVKIFLIQLGSIPIFVMGIVVDTLYYLWLALKKTTWKLKGWWWDLRKEIRQWEFFKIKVSKPKKLRSLKPIFQKNKSLRFVGVFSKILSRQIRVNPLRFRLLVGLFIIILSFVGFALLTFRIAEVLPSPTKLSNTDHPLTTEFYDRSGKLLYRLYEGRNRSLVKLEDLPPYLIQATIAVEDKNFYSHPGLDFFAMLRALRNNIEGGSIQGASTITQQLVKNTLLSSEKTYQRKIKELILSLWTERIYSKNEILQMYFNEVPYGGPAWGIEAASQTYFDKHAKDLTLAEATFLAGLPASPTQYSPYGNDSTLSKTRQKEVLEQMVRQGYLTLSQAGKAYQEPLVIKPPTTEINAPHFVMYLKELLTQKYGERVVSQGGLKVYTTLNLDLQEELERIVKEEVDKLKGLTVGNGAAMVTDAKTGQILAMVGSKDYYDPDFGNYNVALALRQPGSSIKPLTYATAFKKGLTPANIILDTPIRFPDGYAPVNYDGRFHGPVTIRTALGSSYNIPAVKTLASVGIDNMIQTAQDMGITTFTDPGRYGYSLTLGAGEVKLIDMMTVYDSFSQMGKLTPATGILKIEDSYGNTLEQFEPSDKQALQEEVAYLITNILADNNARAPEFGTNSLLNIPGHTVAAKTGTSDNKRDNWTFGYTPDYVVGVWVGNNDNSPMNPVLASGITGAAPIWNRIMTGLLKNQEDLAFERPAGITEITVDGHRDLAIAGTIPKSIVRVIRQDDKIIFQDPFSTFSTSSASLQGSNN